MDTVTWLHLSDWHQDGAGLDFRRAQVRDALLKDIEERTVRINDRLDHVDFVVFSGDVAYHGVPEEYKAATTEFFTPLFSAAGIGPDKLLVVPGNHDVDRVILKQLERSLLHSPSSSDELNDWLSNEHKRVALLEPMKAYREFVANGLGQTPTAELLYGYTRRMRIAGRTVALIGLDSAWLSSRNRNRQNEVEDRGHLALGDVPLRRALSMAESAEICIAVMHHNPEWLAEFERDRVRELLGRQCHFVLVGHQHLPEANRICGTVGDYYMIPAGASYIDATTDQRFVSAYNFTRLNLEAGWGTVYFRKWDERQEKWVKDHSTREDDGEMGFHLPKELGIGASIIASTAELDDTAIIPKLKEWKAVHTNMHTLSAGLSQVTIGFKICEQYSPLEKGFEWYLVQAETAWHDRCAPLLRATQTIFRFEHIQHEHQVKAVLNAADVTESVGQQFGAARSLKDVKRIHNSIAAIKEEIEATLTVADHEIVKLVDRLAQRSSSTDRR